MTDRAADPTDGRAETETGFGAPHHGNGDDSQPFAGPDRSRPEYAGPYPAIDREPPPRGQVPPAGSEVPAAPSSAGNPPVLSPAGNPPALSPGNNPAALSPGLNPAALSPGGRPAVLDSPAGAPAAGDMEAGDSERHLYDRAASPGLAPAHEADGLRDIAPRPLDRGHTIIADEVVEKIAGIASREVPGVYDLGGDVARVFSSVKERLGFGQNEGDQGVSVRLEGTTAAVRVTLVIEYGYVVYAVADKVRANVIGAVEDLLGLEVTGVDIVVDDIHVPDDDEPA
ncbi:MAG: hypothetical protein QOE03_2307 [Micromonosporaceae bacterium]|nr:hypothetical protein [Micromonosporaceae bacterium]